MGCILNPISIVQVYGSKDNLLRFEVYCLQYLGLMGYCVVAVINLPVAPDSACPLSTAPWIRGSISFQIVFLGKIWLFNVESTSRMGCPSKNSKHNKMAL